MTAQIPPVPRGMKRQWVKCRTCGGVSYYDFLPFSLSNPVMAQPCGHGAALRPFEKWEYISADDALRLIVERQT